MSREEADRLVSSFMKRIYSFALQRVANEQDACDVAQEICLKLYRAACTSEIYAEDAFVWKVAKHALANYYREKKKLYVSVSLEELQTELPDRMPDTLERLMEQENYERIRREIAYLSKVRRQVIILFYYEGRKQEEIADILGLPLGTVKWHLNAAKKDLREGMSKMRERTDLAFNPIEFGQIGMSGWDGELGSAHNFFRSALSQNIVYSIFRQERTVGEIADVLGVSPVYVESEIEFLEKYSLVLRKKDRYLANILIEEPTEESVQKHRQLYEKAAGRIANQLYDELTAGEDSEWKELLPSDGDRNFALWSLVFYLLVWGECEGHHEKVAFEEVADLRADGGRNIITASIKTPAGERYAGVSHIGELNGPCWNDNGEGMLWLIDADWTGKRVSQNYGEKAHTDLRLLLRFQKGEELSQEELAHLCEEHYIQRANDGFRLAIVAIHRGEKLAELLRLAGKVKSQVLQELKGELESYKNWVLESERLPKHLKRQREYGLQKMFHADPWFIFYAERSLVESGRLLPVSEEQKYSVTEMLLY